MKLPTRFWLELFAAVTVATAVSIGLSFELDRRFFISFFNSGCQQNIETIAPSLGGYFAFGGLLLIFVAFLLAPICFFPGRYMNQNQVGYAKRTARTVTLISAAVATAIMLISYFLAVVRC
jgi:hypothetical protein